MDERTCELIATAAVAIGTDETGRVWTVRKPPRPLWLSAWTVVAYLQHTKVEPHEHCTCEHPFLALKCRL
jgi:hypothetical protein